MLGAPMGAIYRRGGGQNSSRWWFLMVAVPLPCNGHYGSLLGALRDGRGRGRRGGSVPRSFGERERRGGGGQEVGVVRGHGCRSVSERMRRKKKTQRLGFHYQKGDGPQCRKLAQRQRQKKNKKKNKVGCAVLLSRACPIFRERNILGQAR